MSSAPRSPSSLSRTAVIIWAAALIYMVCVSVVTWPFFIDDAYIGFRYLDNFVHGDGFVFNPPDRVEGVTNIGWLLVVLPFSLVIPVTIAAKILSLFFILAALALIRKLVPHLLGEQDGRVIPLLWPLVIVSNFDFILFSLSGMETALLSFGLILGILLAARRRSLFAAALLGAFLFLVRPETVLVFPLALFFLNGLKWPSWKKHVPAFLVFILIMIALTIGRKLYFGDVLPNTFYAKSTSAALILKNMLSFLKSGPGNIALPFIGWLALPVWALGLRRMWRVHRRIAAFTTAALLSGLFFALYAKPDWTNLGRYFAPYIPLATLVFLIGCNDLVRKLFAIFAKIREPKFIMTLVCLVLIIAGAARTAAFCFTDQRREYPGFVLTGVSLVEPSLWMRDHLPHQTVIATGRIGAISFYSGRRIFDYKFGLTERHVARLKRNLRREFTDPRDPALKEIWLEVKPDYFLEDMDRIRDIFRLGPGEVDSLDIHGLTYRFVNKFRVGLWTDWALFQRTD
jgi:arabinofuranosyltransferase